MRIAHDDRRRPRTWPIALAFGFAAALILTCEAGATAKFGALCQKEFQNGWIDTLDESWNRCQWFVDELDESDTKAFYWNLHGKKPFIETSNDQDVAENVHLLYMSTHGGAWSNTAVYSMWDNKTRAVTTSMFLGNENLGLHLLSTYACDTLKDDGLLPTRWVSAMSGGLKFVSGSHDTVYDGVTTNEQGEDYADELQSGNTLKYAWHDSVYDAYSSEDASVMSTGTDKANCHWRRDTMKWQTFGGYSRITGASIGYFCRWQWTNF